MVYLLLMICFQAYEEFVATFEETPVQKGKIWVKAGTFDAGSRSKSIVEMIAFFLILFSANYLVFICVCGCRLILLIYYILLFLFAIT